jgi:hypothetical protein
VLLDKAAPAPLHAGQTIFPMEMSPHIHQSGSGEHIDKPIQPAFRRS